MGPRCTHERRYFGQVILRDGRRHVGQFCRDCGDNVNGPGRWVAADRCPSNVAELPVVADHRPPEAKGEQRSLFP